MENLPSQTSTNLISQISTTNITSVLEISGSQNSKYTSIHAPLSNPLMPTSLSSHQSYHYPRQYPMPSPPYENLQFPHAYPIQQTQVSQYPLSGYPLYPFYFVQGGNHMPKSFFLQPNSLPIDQEKRALETKAARSMRRLARQRSLSRMSSSEVTSTNQVEAQSLSLINGANTNVQTNTITINKNVYNFCTPDNKRLKVLLSKELKKSDIGSLGRIVLPKRDAEEYLPFLYTKEGIQVVVRDAYSNQEWSLKYKYWSNNKSRMYVLENTVDFVKLNGMKVGDIITLYEDDSKNLYFSIRRTERPVAAPSNELHSTTHNHYNHHNSNYNYIYAPHPYQARDEEEASSLALLIEQLQHKEQLEEANSLEAFYMEPRHQTEEANKLVTISMEPNSGEPQNVISVTNYSQPPVTSMQPSSSYPSNIRVASDQQTEEYYPNLNTIFDYNNFLL